MFSIRLNALLIILVSLLAAVLGKAQNADGTPAPAAAASQKEMYEFRDKGLRALSAKFHQPAIEFFGEYRRLATKGTVSYTDATILLVRAQLLAGNPKAAAEILGRYGKEGHKAGDAYYQTGLVYCRAATALALGDAKTAARLSASLAGKEIDPEYRRLSLRLLGDAAVAQKDWHQAEQAFSMFIAAFPEDKQTFGVYQLLVRAYLSTNQYDKAEKTLQKILLLYPGQPKTEIVRQQILVFARQNKLDQALELYRGIAAERPRTPNEFWWLTLYELGAKFIEKVRYEDALIPLNDAITLAEKEGDRIRTLLAVAECQIALKKSTLAIDTLEKFRQDYPDRRETIPVLLKLAELLRAEHNLMTASDYFALIADNEKAGEGFRYRAAINRGWCLREAGHSNLAREAFEQGAANTSSLPRKAQALLLAGDTAFQTNEFMVAAKLYGRLADECPETKEAARGRFLQARSLFKAERFAEAAEQYKNLLETFPGSEDRETASLERGISLQRCASDVAGFTEAYKAIGSFVKNYPASPQVPKALLEGAQAAEGAGNFAAAVAQLTMLIDNYPDSALYPRALHHRIQLNFNLAKNAEALADSTLFVEKFSLLPLAVEVLMRSGDYYTSIGKYEEAMSCFGQIASRHPNSNLTPIARYEAARCAYLLKHYESAASFIETLRKMTNPKPSADILAKAEFLDGDILALEKKFKEALKRFSRARSLAGNSDLGLAALGRQGEMLYALSESDETQLVKAVATFQLLIKEADISKDLKEEATYRLAKCYEAQGEIELAITNYMNVFLSYEKEVSDKHLRDWFYFVRSGYDVARLLEILGGPGNLQRVINVYERMGKSKIPMAAEARKRAEELRKSHNIIKVDPTKEK